MIDIFNADRIYPNLSSLRATLEHLNFQKLIGAKIKNINLYINKSVIKTRGFHVDCFKPSYKIFIYLSDCLKLSDGPYCYVTESNKPSVLREFNEILSNNLSENQTESPLFDFENVVPILGPAGTLIISDQSGIHRGFPQSLGAERLVLVGRL
jgi:hypothetical protein